MVYRCLLQRRKVINRAVFILILLIVLKAAMIVYYQGVDVRVDYSPKLMSNRGALLVRPRQNNRGSNASEALRELEKCRNNCIYDRPVDLASQKHVNSSPEVFEKNQVQLETIGAIETDYDYKVALRPSIIGKRCSYLDQPAHQQQALSSLRQVDPVFLMKPKLLYCPITKAGSTFFKRLLKAVEQRGLLNSPFDIPIQEARVGDMKTVMKFLRSDESRMELYKQATKFLFTREPYSRVFSAYIDKLYSPNLYYWQQWGKKTVQLSRLSFDAHPCGADVPFRDFVKLLLRGLSFQDIHFTPMSSLCHPCSLQYDVVGKMETAASDVEFLLKTLNISSEFQKAEAYKMAGVLDAIDDSTFDSFQVWFKRLKQCVGLERMSRMIWRKLQIRGLIYSDAVFPFTKEEIENGKLTQTSFRKACKDAASAADSKQRLKKQKEEAMVEAYNSIDFRDLIAIKKLYKTDFYVFGYDPEPKSLFANRRPVNESKILNWKIRWNSLHNP